MNVTTLPTTPPAPQVVPPVAPPASAVPVPRRGAQRRPWVALASGLAVFVAGQLLLAYLIQDRCESWRDPVYGAKIERLEENQAAAPQPPLILLGSSRVACGIHGSPVEEALDESLPLYNFGVPYGGPVLELLTLNRLLEAGIRPAAAVIEVFPAMFSRGFDRKEVRQYPADRFRLREHEFVRRWGGQEEPLREAGLEAVTLPGYTQRLKIVRDLAPGWVPPRLRTDWIADADEYGTASVPVPQGPTDEVRTRALQVARDKYRPALSTFAVGEVGPAALRELLLCCRAQNIHVVLLWMPEGPEFQSWYRPGGRAEFADYLGRVSAEFGVPVIDAQGWMPEESFLDSHHMLAGPAREFSRRLGRALAPLLRPPTESEGGGPRWRANGAAPDGA